MYNELVEVSSVIIETLAIFHQVIDSAKISEPIVS